MSRRLMSLGGMLWGCLSGVAAGASFTTTTMLTATIVASSCVGEVVTSSANGRGTGMPGTVDFGVIHPKTKTAPLRTFSLRLSEVIGGKGCSAFEAYGRQYPVATLMFGDIGQTQLDDNGVILRRDDGSDARLRVRVTPTNAEAIFAKTGGPGYITSTYTDVAYPIAFATQGLFDFQAELSQWDGAKSGRFNGSLTVTVAYR